MMLIMGQSNRIWHYFCGKYEKSVGILIGPSYEKKVPIDPWMPMVLDNDAFIAWRDKKPWDLMAWRKMLNWVKSTGIDPMWAAVPDVVANKEKTIENWTIYEKEITNLGWKTAFCVQDGMTEKDVPKCDVVFVGGTNRWKFPNLKRWTENFPRVHCARVNSIKMIEWCERMGCESVDGTGWFRDPSRKDKLPAIKKFIEGKRVSPVFALQQNLL